ncbi:MAG: hypothetical protein PHO62_07980 [Sulfurimonas sp.]|uniref:hypothetical protein n=1 Tax=Sulfurimonas sp. TaxID=2022749 RepID=UPI00262FEFAF|nr:hypothetical protein [Sulfurimonas sp.]MDD5373346.1 hypothetical protein [Sulfurimonas sp.]
MYGDVNFLILEVFVSFCLALLIMINHIFLVFWFKGDGESNELDWGKSLSYLAIKMLLFFALFQITYNMQFNLNSLLFYISMPFAGFNLFEALTIDEFLLLWQKGNESARFLWFFIMANIAGAYLLLVFVRLFLLNFFIGAAIAFYFLLKLINNTLLRNTYFR